MGNAKILETKSLIPMNWMSVTGLILLFVGVLMVLVAISFLRGLGGSGKTRLGGVVLLGPIPIIFGDRSLAGILLIVAMMFMIMFIVLVFIR